MKRLKIITLLSLLLLSVHIVAQSQTTSADDICGTYLVESPISDDVVKIQIYRANNGKYQGRFVWLSQSTNPDGSPRTDIKNPDPKKRNRTADQIVVVWGLTYQDGEWINGSIYDPNTGKTYSIKGKRAKGSNDMEMRYYWKKPVMGLNTTWKRI